jgi:hypothetical protein
MRTTVRLSDALLDHARREAERRGVTLSALLEEGLRLALGAPVESAARPRVLLPVSKAGGGTLPGIDLNDSAGLLDVLERTDPNS